MSDKMPMVVVAGLILAGLAGLILLRGDSQSRFVDRSVIGTYGLAALYETEEIPLRRSNPRLHPAQDDLAFRILPLYDLDLLSETPRPEDEAELFAQTTQKDLGLDTLMIKLDELPTVMILPKWKTGFIQTGIAHDETLIEPRRFTTLFSQLEFEDMRLRHGGPEFLRGRLFGSEIALFQAQGIPRSDLPDACRPEATLGGTVYVMACDLFDTAHSTWIVTDPDLLNNHGLGLGENTGFALALAARFGGEISKDIYLDTSPDLLVDFERAHDERVEYTRNSEDLGRMFDYPFNVLWAMLLLVLGVVYWRGARRFGPLRRDTGAPEGHALSREASITAKGRLLRLSGHDGHLVSDFARAQLLELTRQVFGPDHGYADKTKLFAHLARQDADLAQRFETASMILIDDAPRLPPSEIYRHLEVYKTVLKQVVERYGSLRISTNH
ncbi:hypothetical protein ACM25N_00320 [Roseovarius sp. C7]|uniref:hypothetical protein n=1 Tax=Roseovarius sp. C7 TaxID=3398643 RepID=UPI0039F62891